MSVYRLVEKWMKHWEVISLCDFLEDLNQPSSPISSEKITGFIKKWEQLLVRDGSPRMFIVKYPGTCPSAVKYHSSQVAETWDKFVLKYDSSFRRESMIDSDREKNLEYLPLNFKELLRLTFYKEMFETVGQQIMTFVFEKCGFVTEHEEGLYVIVACPSGAVYRHMIKAGNGSGNGARMVTSTQGSQGSGRNPRNNPYEIPSSEKPVQVPTAPVKGEEDDDNGDIDEAERWVKPKHADLVKLIKHRNAILTLYNVASSSSEESTEVQSYVHIQKDEDFKLGDKLHVIKQKSLISHFPPKLPEDWKGLKIENPGGKPVKVHVYHISQTLAKQIGIRLKPKGRCRKRKGLSLNEPKCEDKPSGPEPCYYPIAPYQPTIPLSVAPALYNKSSKSQWPSNHSLTEAACLGDKELAVKSIIKCVLKVPVCSEAAYTRLQNQLLGDWGRLADLIWDVIQSHKRINDIHGLVKSCVFYWHRKLAQAEHQDSNLRPFTELGALTHRELMQTLKQILHVLKADKLLGTKSNVRGFFKFVHKAIILGGVKSSLQLGELMSLIRPLDTPLAEVCNNDLFTTEVFLAKVSTWLFNEYLLVLLRMSFYITECSNKRFQLQFFLRESWVSATDKMKTKLITQGALNSVKSQGDSPALQANAVVRYIPKPNKTLRSLLIRNKNFFRITKEEEKSVILLLNHIDAKINKDRMQITSTIQTQWKKFLREFNKKEISKLYFLRMDIKDAFPSVSCEKLKAILYETIGKDKSEVVEKQFLLFGESVSKRRPYRSSIVDNACRSSWYSGIQVRPCIVMDRNMDKKVDVGKILHTISDLIQSPYIVQIGKKFYEFKYGLPQGWGLSSILCSIYYGYIDSKLYLPYLESKGRFFLRIVDDYLFVTPMPEEVLNLIQLVKIGCNKYGIRMNEEKFETNVFVTSQCAVSDLFCDHTTFCGWDFCFTYGHVSRDFKKYEGQDFCSTISFHLKGIKTPEQFIQLRGTMIMPARLKSIVVDPSINCPGRLLRTCYEAAISLGFRFYALCRVVFSNLNVIKDSERAEILVDCIRKCSSKLARKVLQNCRSSLPNAVGSNNEICLRGCCADPTNGTNHCRNFVNYNAFFYASLRGFRVKLLKHSSVFKDHVLPQINTIIYRLEKSLGIICRDAILNIIGTKMPACFEAIVI